LDGHRTAAFATSAFQRLLDKIGTTGLNYTAAHPAVGGAGIGRLCRIAAGVFARTVPRSCVSAEAAHIVVDGGAPSAADKNWKREKEEVSFHNDLLVLFVAILLVSPTSERLHPSAKIRDELSSCTAFSWQYGLPLRSRSTARPRVRRQRQDVEKQLAPL
jgi:hypothetical protein